MTELILGTNIETGRIFYAPHDLRFRHAYILGRTGAGKSSLMQNMVHQDIEEDYAIVIFDPGDLANNLVKTFPRRFIEDVIEKAEPGRVLYFSINQPIPYNPFLRRRNEPERLENELISLINEITIQGSRAQPLTPRMKDLFGIALRHTLEEYTEPNFSNLATYILEHEALIRVEMGLADPKEYGNTQAAVLDRLKQFLRDRRIRRVLCNPHQLDFDEIINEGKILIVSLQGLEPHMVKFLGTVLFQGLQSTIRERSIPKRKECAIYIDEFQQFLASHHATENFQDIFKYGRGYLTSLCVAHQDFGGIERDLLRSIHGNAAVAISFSSGPDEASQMSRIFGSRYKPDDVSFQKDYFCFARVGNEVVKIKTYPPDNDQRDIRYEEMIYTSPDPPDPFQKFSTRQVAEEPAAYDKMNKDEPAFKDIEDSTLERIRRHRGADNEQPPESPKKKTRKRDRVQPPRPRRS